MKKTLLFLAVLTLTTTLCAQGPGPMPQGRGPEHMGPMPPMHGMAGGSWWKNSEVAEKLKLTDQQKQQLESTFLDYRLKLVDLRADVERQELKLQPLMDADQVNEAQVSSQLDAVIAARGKLEKTNAMMMISMRKVLTADQWKQLRNLRTERFRNGRREMGTRRGGTIGPDSQPTSPPPPPDTPKDPGED
ncbi:MAG: Spy/CpxP family protein refolding chaperone [Acidobacteriaceae bacterium]